VRTPASVGDHPFTFWKYSVMKKTTPKSARPTNATSIAGALKSGRRKNSSGIIGVSVRDSQATNAAIRARPATRKPIV
jgi:hypothetical protein